MVCRGRNQFLPLHALQEAAGLVLLVVRPELLGCHPAAGVHHISRLWGLDGPEGIYYYDISDLVHHGGPTELGPVFALTPDHVSFPRN